jgi:X-Pro dipeptidyl-peptidase
MVTPLLPALASCLLALALLSPAVALADTQEEIYVETPLDTDGDGKLDRLWVFITRPDGATDVPAILTVSPYGLGGNPVTFHGVDVALLPQDERLERLLMQAGPRSPAVPPQLSPLFRRAVERGYAFLTAHSLGTRSSQGCPGVGDATETLAVKAVIDWLNGRARGYAKDGQPVAASWASGSVGMSGVSYVGTLPNMVATTGVEGLKAIVPMSAISDWYDYYRANGLVVSPGGYQGEDADVLATYVARKGCAAAIAAMTEAMGREHGDLTPFWEERNYVSRAADVRAAVFVIHGQADWNVKQRHAIRWWEALEGRVPTRLWLHRDGHGEPWRPETWEQIWAWFDRYVKGEENGVELQPRIEVEGADGEWTSQESWPHESTANRVFHLNPDHSLAEAALPSHAESFVDEGKTTPLPELVRDPASTRPGRIAFVGAPLASPTLLSGTPTVRLELAVRNRRAANVTVAVVEYRADGSARIVTRGWADPQNHADLQHGELLDPGTPYALSFQLEPKQTWFAAGSRIGVVVASTDREFTLRPDPGTELSVTLGAESSIELSLSGS